ncbi:unnamed protein product [Arctia plantaginis]|uniref:Uncharacterized protein n=1 Tax=Arctia plantaginis TaxID=874455 RepID=A0A8S0YWJ5_ARCPL|nr:unnamed protein product [Arctia plantaginis]CAB3247878.1 unnamed protein product [Arctia plantaginis]
MMISPVVNLDNAKDRSSAGGGKGRDGDSDAGFVRFTPHAVRPTVPQQSVVVSATVGRLMRGARASS